MPLSHLCLIPNTDDGLSSYRIYRGGTDSNDHNELPFRFGPQHAWLQHVIAVPKQETVICPVGPARTVRNDNFNDNDDGGDNGDDHGDVDDVNDDHVPTAAVVTIHGTVQDGDVMTTETGEVMVDIADGDGDTHVGLHQACWELLLSVMVTTNEHSNSNVSSSDNDRNVVCWSNSGFDHIPDTDEYQQIANDWHDQVFDFATLQASSLEWMLVDPRLHHGPTTIDDGPSDSIAIDARRNRERILSLIRSDRPQQRNNGLGQNSGGDNTTTTTTTTTTTLSPFQPSARLSAFYDFLNGNTITLYDILSVNVNATDREIARAFKRKQIRCHPNAANGGDAAQYERLCIAHNLLSRFRNEYNQLLHDPSNNNNNNNSDDDNNDRNGNRGEYTPEELAQQERFATHFELAKSNNVH